MTTSPTAPPGARFADPDSPSLDQLLFDLQSDQLPSGLTASVLPIRGPAERALMASFKAEGAARIDHMVRFLLLVVDKLDGKPPTEDAILDLADEDQRPLFLRCRFASFPESTRVEFGWDCKPPALPRGLGCGARGNGGVVDLDRLPFLPLPTSRTAVLGQSKRQASWPANTLRVQKEYLARRRAGSDLDLDAILQSRKVQLDGKVATPKQLDDLVQADRSQLRRELTRWGGVDSRVIAECIACRQDLNSLVEALPGFFFPETTGG